MSINAKNGTSDDLASMPDEAPLAPIAENSPNGRQLAPGASQPPDHPSPDERAERTAIHYHRGSEEIIACGVEVNNAGRALRKDAEGMKAYLAGLVRRGMLTDREAADPQGSAKLSRLRKIGQHESMLQNREISRRVGAGYTKMERCCAIYDEVEGTDEQKLQKLLEILESCPNEEVDRAYLIDAYDELKRQRNAVDNDVEEPADESVDETAEDQINKKSESDGATTWPELLAKKQRFNRILITPRPKDMRLIAKKLADPEKLHKELPIKEVIASGNAVVVVSTTVRDYPLVMRELTRGWGFKKAPAVLLARKPEGPDIGDARVLITLGDLKPAIAELWVGGHDPDDVRGDAQRLFPGGTWLHVFADDACDDWTTLIAGAGWVEAAGEAQ